MYFIFCRSGFNHGLGHLSRMINLGYQLHLKNQLVALITNEESLSVIPDRFFSVHAYGGNPTIQEMLYKSIVMYPESSDHVLIVDDKEVMDEDVRSIPWNLRACISIDNPAANRDGRTYDLLVYPNAHMMDDEIYQSTTRFAPGKVFHGSQYVIMNHNLVKPRKISLKRPSVTLCAGGSDPDRYTKRLAPLMENLSSEWTFDVMAGELSGLNYRRFCHSIVEQCSIFICQWGVTVYEAMCVGTPVLTWTRNFRDFYRAKNLQKRSGGAIEVLPPDFSDADFVSCVQCLTCADNRSQLAVMGESGYHFIDNQGSERVANVIIQHTCG